MTPASIDTLTERVEGVREDVRDLGEQLEAHRREAAESAAGMRGAMEEVRAELVKLADMRDRQTALEETVNGKGDEPGLKGRQDRTERTVAVALWVIGGIVLVCIGRLVEWASAAIHFVNGSPKT